jgi:hypothetical protein
MLNRSIRSLLLLIFALIAVRNASAEGRILLKNPVQAAAAIAAGMLNPVSASNSNSITLQNQFSTDPIGMTAISTTLTTNGSFFTTTNPTTMAAHAPVSGGWYYAYGVDPDLTGYTLNIEFDVPQLYNASTLSGIQDIGIGLVDTSGNMEIWTWDASALVRGTNDFTFSLAAGAGADGATSFFDNGLNLSEVTQVQFSYDGTFTSSFPHNPTGGTGLWTLIDQATVLTPEPSATLSLMLGVTMLAGWTAYRSRRRSRRKPVRA